MPVPVPSALGPTDRPDRGRSPHASFGYPAAGLLGSVATKKENEG